MTAKGERAKSRIAESMLTLMQRQGFSGTGITEVVEHAGAPKGSLYFHFPDGKEGLGIAAVDLAARRFTALIEEAAADRGPAEALRFAFGALTSLVRESDYQLGCPVSVVTLEMGAESERLRDACAAAFAAWIDPTARLLQSGGLGEAEAVRLATAVVASIEGAVILARAARSTQPLEATAEVLAQLVALRIAAAGERA
ncbi:TetR/AcrR family transcriptional regulator [Leucobacter chromiiresistens]